MERYIITLCRKFAFKGGGGGGSLTVSRANKQGLTVQQYGIQLLVFRTFFTQHRKYYLATGPGRLGCSYVND